MSPEDSCGKVLLGVFELQVEMWIFLEEWGYWLANMYINSDFLIELSYLNDLFQKLSELNLQMQGTYTHCPQLPDKVTSFTRELEVDEQC